MRFSLDQEGNSRDSWDIALNDKSKTVTVADVYNKRVQTFDFDGNFLREIALDAQTYSVAFTESGDLHSFVARVDRKLPLYTEGGQFIQYISDEHATKPWYISVGSEGRILSPSF